MPIPRFLQIRLHKLEPQYHLCHFLSVPPCSHAGVALFKHARQVLRRDADARVADAERFRRLERDGH